MSSDAVVYPEAPPFNSGMLTVSELHRIYFEQSGAHDGIPVVYLHGGPGAGLEPSMRRCHDPANYRLIMFDQRGAGRSTPSGEVRENTTWDLVEDVERLRIVGHHTGARVRATSSRLVPCTRAARYFSRLRRRVELVPWRAAELLPGRVGRHDTTLERGGT